MLRTKGWLPFSAALLVFVFFLVGCAGNISQIEPRPDGNEKMQKIVAAVSDIPDETIEEHKLVAHNTMYSLYLNEEAVSVILKDNATGHMMKSAVSEASPKDSPLWRNFIRSGICIEYFPSGRMATTRADMFSKGPEKTITRTEDGFAAKISYTELGISFSLIVTLTDTGITAEIPQASIREINTHKLAAIYVFPFMGYSSLGERQGYMFIPDGCGALISLKDNDGKYQQPYSARIYGSDYGIQEQPPEVQLLEDGSSTTAVKALPVAAPIYGMVHTDNQIGYIAVIEKGQYDAEIYAYPSGALTQYNWITSKFTYRETYSQPTSKTSGIKSLEKQRRSFDIRIYYRFVVGDDADYVGLAKAYREYLQKAGVFSDNTGKFYVRLDFMGGDVEKSLLGTKFIPMTTTQHIESIISDLREKGANDLMAIYKGWQKDGLYGDFPQKNQKPEIKLGSVGNLKSTSNKLKNMGIPFYLYLDPLLCYSPSRHSSSDIIYRINGQAINLRTNLSLHPESTYFTPIYSANLLESYQNFITSINAEGLAIDGITNHLSSFNQKSGMISRKNSAQIYLDSLKSSDKKLLFSPFDYLWGSASDYLDFPLYGSNYKFVDKEIPFFAIVLKGNMNLYGEYVNFKADNTEFYLKMIESGVYPSFLISYERPSALIYSDSNSMYSMWHEDYTEMIATYSKTFRKLAGRHQGCGHYRSYPK